MSLDPRADLGRLTRPDLALAAQVARLQRDVDEIKQRAHGLRAAGAVDSAGVKIRGFGFVCSRLAVGQYRLTWIARFDAVPSVAAMAAGDAGPRCVKQLDNSLPTKAIFDIGVFTTTTGAAVDAGFWFVALDSV